MFARGAGGPAKALFGRWGPAGAPRGADPAPPTPNPPTPHGGPGGIKLKHHTEFAETCFDFEGSPTRAYYAIIVLAGSGVFGRI